MRIDALNQISQVYGTNEKRKISYASRVSESDKLEISSFGKDTADSEAGGCESFRYSRR